MVPDSPERDSERPSSAEFEPGRHVSRPETEASYGIPDDEDGVLSWSFVTERLATDESFWVSTTRPDGRPHARPVWGVWLEETFHCGGGEGTRWVRNLEHDPAITVHTEDAESVVILEGRAAKLTDSGTDENRLERIDDSYEAKYGVRHGTPVFAVRPTTVLAWSEYPEDATRWHFSGDGSGDDSSAA